MQLFGRSISVILASFLVAAAGHAQPAGVDAPVALLIDHSSNAVLFSRNADRPMPPASMAKMMTVYTAFDAIEKGDISLDQTCKVGDKTFEKWNNRGSTMFLRRGQTPTVENLLDGIITLSGNDASVVLADCISGSESSFTKRMNRVAKQIGLEDSHFGTANGWPDEGRTMVTAYDMARLAAASMRDHQKLYDRFYGRPKFSWNGITQPNRNPLLGRIDGADGLKTGHTEEAGYAFTGSVEQNGRRLIFVVSQLDSEAERIDQSIALANWGFNAFERKKLFEKGRVLQKAKVQQGANSEVDLVAGDTIHALLPSGSDKSGTMSVSYKGPLKAPITKGQTIAWLEIEGEGGLRQSIPLVAGESVEKAGFFGRAWAGLKHLLGLS